MELIEIDHEFGTPADKNTNIGFIAASSSGGEIACAWRSSTLTSPGSQLEGQSVFKPSSPLYRTDNTAVAGALAIPLGRVDATFAVVTFLNNTDKDATVKLTAAIGNRDGTSKSAAEKTATVAPGDSASYQIAFIPH